MFDNMKHLLISGNKFKEANELVQKWFSMGTSTVLTRNNRVL